MNPQLTQSEYQRTAKNPYRSFDGADGEVRVPNGEWYVNTKARTARMMKNGLSRGARQVYACLELATMGFDREKALVWEKVRTKEGTTKLIERPQTNADIAGLSGLDESDTSRFFRELCVEGLAEAREIIEGKGLHKGNIQLYSWAQPREPKKEESWVRAPTIPDWFPSEDPALQPLRTALSRRRSWSKIQNMDDGARTTFLVMCEETARTIKEAEEAVARLEDYACAQAQTTAHIKEDKQDRHKEQTPPPSQPVLLEVLPAPEPPPAPIEAPPVDPPAPAIKQIKPVGWLGEGLENNSSLKTEVEKHLKQFDVPDRLSQEMVAEIAKPIATQGILEQFKEATALDRVKPRTWAFFVKKAKEVAEDWPRYAAAKATAGNGSPPGSPPTRSELRLRDLIRRLAVEEEEP